MDAIELTDPAVRSVTAPASGRVEMPDAKVPGLLLRITDTGAKSWSVRYTPKGLDQRRATLGRYPLVTLSAARRRALDIVTAAAHGRDLIAEEQKAAAAQRGAAVAEQQKAQQPQTVGALLDEYVARYCKSNQRRWKLTEAIFENHVKPAIGNVALAELRRKHVIGMLDDLQNQKGLRAQVNRVRTETLAALNWGVERDYLEANPASTVKRRKRIERSRERVLTDSELRDIWSVADDLPEPSRSLVMAWVLTGQRRDEVRCLPWSEIDATEALWTLPAHRNKGKRDHEVPLSPPLMALLRALPRIGKPVFTVDGARPYAGQKRLKAILDRSGVTNWTFHDLRRTMSTNLAALGASQDTIDRVLNHAKQSLAGTYNRHLYRAEKRAALDMWADHVLAVVAIRAG